MTKNNKSIQEPKNITLSELRSEAKEMNTMEYYDLDDNSRVGFYPIFSYKKIEELHNEMQDIHKQADELKINLSEDEVVNHIMFLMIKHFTHLKESISNKIENQINIMDTLVDTGFFATMFEDVFMVSEVDKVFDHLGAIIGKQLFGSRISKSMQDTIDKLSYENSEALEEFEELKKELLKEEEVTTKEKE